MKFDVVCFGALNVDKLYRVNRIAREDEHSFIMDFVEAPGGSAANTAVGLARLGLRVGYIGKVANDDEGEFLLNDFKKENVDIKSVAISKTGISGIVFGFIDEQGNRALYVAPGVNGSLAFEEINLEYTRNTGFLHFTSFVGEKSFIVQKKFLKAVSNVKISFDPGELYARKELRLLKPFLERSYVVSPNENELKLLTGKDYKEGSKILLKEGARIIAVKLGKKGCYITDGKESHSIESYKVKVVDTTGAGDAFCAGFLYGLIKGKDLYECGRLGNFVASRCITKIGARDGLPKLTDLQEM
jgi:ribokinase